MSFKVFLHPKAAKELKKLDEPLKSKIKDKLRDLTEKPEKKGKLLKYTGFRILKVGKYRVIYEIYMEEKKVVILFIGHRKRVYTDFSRIFF